MSRPDAELVARCRAGDSDAFEALYREHSPRLFALARRMTGSPHESEDLLQEIFLQVHRKLDSYRGESALGTWLYRLAVRQCLDFLRSRQGRMPPPMKAFDFDLPFEFAQGVKPVPTPKTAENGNRTRAAAHDRAEPRPDGHAARRRDAAGVIRV